MSITAIRNGLYTLLTASGPWTAAEISTCSFDCLERGSGCAITFFPEGTTDIEPLAFGSGGVQADQRHWRIGGTVWIREDGNPQTILGGIWRAYDDIYNTIRKDNTLGGTCDRAMLTDISTTLNRFQESGGHVWKPVDWVVIADEF